MVVEINDANFKEVVLGESKPVIVDFWAEWCGPCRSIVPLVHELSDEYDGRVLVCKMDIDSNSDVPTEYGIRSIPTILFFKDGKMVDRIVGAVPKTIIASKLQSII